MRRILIELLVLTVSLVIFFRIFAYYDFNIGWVAAFTTLTVPASIAGELHGRRNGKDVSSGFAWQVAFAGAAAVAILNGLFSAIRFPYWSLFDIGVILGGSLAIFIVSFLSIRVVFRWGVTFGVRRNPQLLKPDIFD